MRNNNGDDEHNTNNIKAITIIKSVAVVRRRPRRRRRLQLSGGAKSQARDLIWNPSEQHPNVICRHFKHKRESGRDFISILYCFLSGAPKLTGVSTTRLPIQRALPCATFTHERALICAKCNTRTTLMMMMIEMTQFR